MNEILGEKYLLKKKYAAANKAKEEKRRAKKEKYHNENFPVVEMRIPTFWNDDVSNGPIRNKYIDISPGERHEDWPAALEEAWRVNTFIRTGERYTGPVKYKIIRT